MSQVLLKLVRIYQRRKSNHRKLEWREKGRHLKGNSLLYYPLASAIHRLLRQNQRKERKTALFSPGSMLHATL